MSFSSFVFKSGGLLNLTKTLNNLDFNNNNQDTQSKTLKMANPSKFGKKKGRERASSG